MTTTLANMPPVGSLWRSPEGREFRITALELNQGDAWVSYTGPERNHSCRLAAFLTRFSPEPK
jgi:hypothetical protein